MAFGKNQDPRYRGNFQVLLTLVLLAAVAAGVLGAMFWLRDRKGPPQAPVAQAAPAKPAPPKPVATPAVPTPSPEEVVKREKLDGLRKQIAESRDSAVIAGLAQEILLLEPEDAQAWNVVGQTREAQGDVKEAIAAYDRSGASPSRTYYSYFLKGRLLRQQGDMAGALANLEEARRLKTDSVILANLIMIFRLQAGQAEDVRSEVRVFQKSEVRANVDQWLFGAAALALQDGNEERAITFSRRFRNLVNPEIYKILISDSFFDPYREKFPTFFSINQ
jgi:tetratricopeptide (TPR) repeat protein